MKKLIFVLFAVVAMVFFVTCSEEFEPNASVKEVYVLNCILRGDTTVQYAIVSGSFGDINSQNQYFVNGAKIVISYNDSIFVMRDTIVNHSNAGKNLVTNCYYVKNLRPVINKTIGIEAKLPSGALLRSVSQTLKVNAVYFYGSDNIIPPKKKNTDYLVYIWDDLGGTLKNRNSFFVPRLQIFYTERIGNKLENKEIQVPSYYLGQGGQSIPIYPEASHDNYAKFTLEAVTKTLKSIIAPNNDQNNYSIVKAVFSVLILDENLTKYYIATQTYLEGFTVSLAEPDFTNIEGGKGIFGNYVKFNYEVTFDKDYLSSMGF